MNATHMLVAWIRAGARAIELPYDVEMDVRCLNVKQGHDRDCAIYSDWAGRPDWGDDGTAEEAWKDEHLIARCGIEDWVDAGGWEVVRFTTMTEDVNLPAGFVVEDWDDDGPTIHLLTPKDTNDA